MIGFKSWLGDINVAKIAAAGSLLTTGRYYGLCYTESVNPTWLCSWEKSRLQMYLTWLLPVIYIPET